MKNIKLFHTSLIIAFLFLVASCSSKNDEPVDTEKPTITINSPKDKEHLHPKDRIHADIDFTDNVELASWKIDIHWAGDGHKHDDHAVVNTQNGDAKTKWETTLTGSISGQRNAHIHKHIDVPEGIEGGNHHFCVHALDKAGNEAKACIDLDIHVSEGGNHNHDEIKTYAELVEEVTEHLSVTLPDFANLEEFKFVKFENDVFTYQVKTNPRKANLVAYFTVLESAGWSKSDGSNDHKGSYIKSGVKLSYHESHDDATTIDFTIGKDNNENNGGGSH